MSERRLFHAAPDEPVLHVARVRSLDGVDVMLERTAYAPWVAAVIRTIPGGQTSVSATLQDRFGIRVGSAVTTVDALLADDADAALLGGAARGGAPAGPPVEHRRGRPTARGRRRPVRRRDGAAPDPDGVRSGTAGRRRARRRGMRRTGGAVPAGTAPPVRLRAAPRRGPAGGVSVAGCRPRWPRRRPPPARPR
ncbi:UTRA domain-containing protein [Curtobacterium flaccumfaciens]|nr:UTRA domain-containing protein [Curtobacterium flaccumfaciens]